VEFGFDQALPTWIQLHGLAFTFVGGVRHRVVLDYLRAGIVKACFDDPQVQSTDRECAEPDGFLLAPYRPRPPEHQGKVEHGGVHSVKHTFLGGREPTPIIQANAAIRQWCLATAGQRRQGTTKEAPLDRFEAIAQAQLKPLPALPYDLAI
jgi:transposase